MSYKFKNLNNLIYQTYKALKYLEDKKIRYCIFYIGNREDNRLENFYKEIKSFESKKSIFETKFQRKIKDLTNELYDLKDTILSEVVKCGKEFQKLLFDNENIFKATLTFSNASKLPDFLKLQIDFYYFDENIIIPVDDKYITKGHLLTKEDFKKKFKKLLKSQNLEKLMIFIDSNNILKNNEKNVENPLILIKNDFKSTDIYGNIKKCVMEHITTFHKIYKGKMDNKIKYLKENKKVFNSSCNLTLQILKEKLKNEKDLCFDEEKLVDFLSKKCEGNIEKKEEYANKLLLNKKELDKLMKNKDEIDIRNKVLDRFGLLFENIKATVIYDYITNKFIGELYSTLWDLYRYDM